MSLHWKAKIKQRLQQRKEAQLWRERAILESPQGSRIVVRGKELVNFCSNDYLGLANHPVLREAAIEAIQKWGCGSGASHMICGHSELHEQVEYELAQFVGAEKAVLFSTGYMANLAIPQTFLGRYDHLIADRLNHASLIDAAEMVKGTTHHLRFQHGDWQNARGILSLRTDGQRMILTDGVFSMDGDLAPLPQLSALADEYQALLVVDDAHGFGVMGNRGAGTLEHFQIPVRHHILMMGTLGKAVGSFGAFVAGDRDWIEALIQFARTYIYTTATPAVMAATTLAAIKMIREQPERRLRLHERVNLFRNLATAAGLKLATSQSAIQPFFPAACAKVPDQATGLVIEFSQRLLQAGFWVSAIRPPTVPVGTDRLRITITSEHSEEDIQNLVRAMVVCEQEQLARL